MRINKFLSSQGVCSRREADDLVDNGRVLVNSEIIALGQQLEFGDLVEVFDAGSTRSRELLHSFVYTEESEQEKIYIAFNKPPGIVCTSKQENSADVNIIEYLSDFIGRVYPVGRLDKESRGLILLSNDGDFTFRMTHPKFQHEKEYIVSTLKPIDQKFISSLQLGVKIHRTDDESELVKTAPCKAELISDKQFRIVLTEGMNRQIRKMCAVLDNRVQDLQRVRIANYQLGELAEGDYRLLKSAPCSLE